MNNVKFATVIGLLVVGGSTSYAILGKSETRPLVTPLTGEAICSRDLTKFVQFKDPASVRINSVTPNDARPGRYYLSVSAKNSFGGYADATTCTCGVDTATAAATDIHCDNRG